MVFSKAFPRLKDGITRWEEVSLSYEEELTVEDQARKENIKLMIECIGDAKRIMGDQGLKDFQSDVITIAKALFDKRASHEIYFKENKAKEKFDQTPKPIL